MQAFFKILQKFQNNMIENINQTLLEIDNILKDKEEMEKAVDRIDVDFEIAAFVTSIETMK